MVAGKESFKWAIRRAALDVRYNLPEQLRERLELRLVLARSSGRGDDVTAPDGSPSN